MRTCSTYECLRTHTPIHFMARSNDIGRRLLRLTTHLPCSYFVHSACMSVLAPCERVYVHAQLTQSKSLLPNDVSRRHRPQMTTPVWGVGVCACISLVCVRLFLLYVCVCIYFPHVYVYVCAHTWIIFQYRCGCVYVSFCCMCVYISFVGGGGVVCVCVCVYMWVCASFEHVHVFPIWVCKCVRLFPLFMCVYFLCLCAFYFPRVYVCIRAHTCFSLHQALWVFPFTFSFIDFNSAPDFSIIFKCPFVMIYVFFFPFSLLL